MKRFFSTSFALCLGVVMGQGSKIGEVRISADGRLVLQYPADASSYYILRKGDLVTAIHTASSMWFA